MFISMPSLALRQLLLSSLADTASLRAVLVNTYAVIVMLVDRAYSETKVF